MQKKINEWLNDFLESRGLECPDGRFLYEYKTTEQEYWAISSLLKKGSGIPEFPTHKAKWSACYCLVASEFYRREYNSKWSLTEGLIRDRVPTDFDNNDRYEVIRIGLKFWRRELKKSNMRIDYVGTVFREGGLPWPLLQDNKHGFGYSVEYSLRHYNENIQFSRPIKESIKETWERWPKTFQTEETAILLGKIVARLIALASEYQLKGQSNPADYLDRVFSEDRVFSDWNRSFPLPLEKENARLLVNEWLTTASEEWDKKKLEVKNFFTFSHSHSITDNYSLNKIKANIFFPEEYTINIEKIKRSTRLEWVIYEGMHSTNVSGIIYANIVDDAQLQLKFKNQMSNINQSFVRRYINEMINIRFYNNGELIRQEFLHESDIDISNRLLCFAKNREDYWQLLIGKNPTSKQLPCLFRLPDKFNIIESKANNLFLINCDEYDGKWYETDGEIIFQNDNGDKFNIDINGHSFSSDAYLYGNTLLDCYSSKPIYLGLPTLLPSSLGCSKVYINDDLGFLPVGNPKEYGLLKVSYYTDNKILYKQKLQVLPKDFGIQWEFDESNKEVRLSFKGDKLLDIKVYSSKGLEVDPDKNKVYRFVKSDEISIDRLKVYLSNNKNKPVIMDIILPYNDAVLYDEGKNVINNDKVFLVDKLLGKRIVLRASSPTTVYLDFKLEDGKNYLEYTIPKYITDKPLEISLEAMRPTINQLLSISDSLDETVKLVAQPTFGQSLLQLSFKRYDSVLDINDDNSMFCCFDIMSNDLRSDCINKSEALVCVMSLSRPDREYERLERNNEHSGYIIPSYMKDGQAWIVYPDPQSNVRFRPKIFTLENRDFTSPDLKGLALAANCFHPEENPDVFFEYIEIMADYFEDANWSYLESLKNNYGHLPLSTFELWKRVASRYKVLVSAVLRLGLDETFCQRLTNELAVNWDLIPISLWIEAVKHYDNYLKVLLGDNFSEDVKNEILEDIKNAIPLVATNYSDELREYLVLEKPKLNFAIVKFSISEQYQKISNIYSEAEWPDDLNNKLKEWFDLNDDLYKIRDLLPSINDNHYSVVYLPVFFALLKVECANLNDLKISDNRSYKSLRKIIDFDFDWFNYLCAMLTCYFKENC